ncbi:MAG TPA: NADH dehydrogenase (quinone) subunit D [Armatimonadota bacterium]|jgi:NADH-quinone oxidoreductase subunit D
MTTDLLGEASGAETAGVTQKTMTLNLGPQHPSTHGVLRLLLELDGETVVNCQPHIGYLHTGFEKNMEAKTYHKAIPYTDRMDYLSAMIYNVAYVQTVEKLCGIEITPRCAYVRTLVSELQRIASHMVWYGTTGMDLGASTAFLYAFRDREDILDFFEELAGGRLTPSYTRVGGMAADLTPGFEERCKTWLVRLPGLIDDYEALLTNNEVFLERTQNVGTMTAEDLIALGVTGPVLRASGFDWDIRRSNPYLIYDKLDFKVCTATGGDVFSRYKVRMGEMREAVKICLQVLDGMPGGEINISDTKYRRPPKDTIMVGMEELIHHFKIATAGFPVPAGEAYVPVESSKGELGFYVVSDGTGKPQRVRVRPPSLLNLQALPQMARGRMIADVVALIGSIDIVLGEVDR